MKLYEMILMLLVILMIISISIGILK